MAKGRRDDYTGGMRKRIGEYLVERGVLKPTEVERILSFGKASGLRFGEAGLELGLLTKESLVKAFGRSYWIDFFHLDPAFFPQATQNFFSVEFILRYGVLPLGTKSLPGLFRARKLLNLGLLDPSRKDVLEACSDKARSSMAEGEFAGVKTYLVLAPEFVAVLEKQYGVAPAAIGQEGRFELDPTLQMYLDL